MAAEPGAIKEMWLTLWPRALEVWSSFTRLGEPRWCWDDGQAAKEGLGGNFAMIRLDDHSVVLDLREIGVLGLEKYGMEIMAHEIGHHIYCPSDLTDMGLMIARIRRGLPEKEDMAPLVSNLYSDLLINDRLQRRHSLDMAGVYRTMNVQSNDRLWNFYMRIYEILWSIPKGELARGGTDTVMDADARLGARLLRVYSRDWLDGAGSFAALCYTYLEDTKGEDLKKTMKGWLDTENAGAGGEPAGLTEMDDGETEAPLHPSMDKNLAGTDPLEDDGDGEGDEGEEKKGAAGKKRGRAEKGGAKNRKAYRGVSEYGTLLKALRKDLTDHDIAVMYYRERALPHLIRFPEKTHDMKTDPLPEGLETWDIGMPVEDVDWFDSVMMSPRPVPGVTTLQRVYGMSPGTMPRKAPLDLYIGIDCSGSMPNPQYSLSFPVLAGVIMALSALRAGARVMAVLSGEPGESVSTGGFGRSQQEVLSVLTSYLGTGYAFGIRRLAETFMNRKFENPVHIIIITDSDIFSMLDEPAADVKLKPVGMKDGWDVAKISRAAARGGGTYVLHTPYSEDKDHTARMKKDGWGVSTISTWEDIIIFARDFSRRNYEK